jgi:AcrR family transcriptional regulator
MSHIVAVAARPYRSALRAQQADDTRGRILDAAIRVMAAGIASLSIPAVASEAGVSVPTVYRHFRSKRELLAALYPHAVRRAGLDALVVPRSVDELRDGVRALFERLDAAGDLARAAMASPAAEEARAISMPERLAFGRRIVDSAAPRVTKRNRERIARLIVILTTSSALRTWRDHLGSSVDEAADDIDWVVRAAIAAAVAEKSR